MKKIFFLTVLTLICCVSSDIFATSLICQPINGPCPSDQYAWSTAKTLTICGGEYGLTTCAETCCFVIQYYDRFRENGNEFNYDVSMANIFYPTDPNCIDCVSMEAITRAAYDKLMSLNWQRQGFRDSTGWQTNSLHNENLYTPTQCRDINSELKCSENLGCCTTVIENQIGPDNEYVGFAGGTWTDDKGPCPIVPIINDCHKFCFGFNKDLTESYLTPCQIIPCFPNWQSICIDVNMPGCYACSLSICYRRAENNCQPSTYYDIEIDSIVNVNNSCAACIPPINMTTLYTFALQKVLFKEGQVLDYEENECEERFRILQSKCWRTDYNSELLLLKWVACGYEEGCCWSRYKVCHTEVNTVTVELIEHCGQSVVCQYVSGINNCQSICGLDASGTGWRISLPDNNNVIQNNDVRSFVAPNPSDEFCELHVVSNEKGIIDLVVYDILGNSVFSQSKTSNGNELIFQINNNLIPVGVYHYNIMINNRLLNNGSFNILR